MSDLRTRYLACWNATDAEVRSDLVARDWAGSATYVDPLVEATGREQLVATIAAVQQQFPGWVFTPSATSTPTTGSPASAGGSALRARSRPCSASTWSPP